LKHKLRTYYIPVMTSLSQVMATTAELRIPDAANAKARGNCHSSEAEPGPFNMRKKAPLVEPEADLPWWNRKGVPCPSEALGFHLCITTFAAGALVSTTIIESFDAEIAAAGTLQCSGLGTA